MEKLNYSDEKGQIFCGDDPELYKQITSPEDLSRVDWSLIIARSKSHPREAAYRDLDGCYPLHVMLRRTPPTCAVEAVIKAHSEAASAQGNSGFMALHQAIYWQSSDEVCSLVLRANRKAARSKDKYGRLPLHYVWKNMNSTAMTRFLLEEYPEGAMIKDIYGKTPLNEMLNWFVVTCAYQNLVNNYQWEKLSLMLLTAHHGVVSRKHLCGKQFRALHSALYMGFPLCVLKLSIKLYPWQVEESDEEGKLPLLIAIESKFDEAIVNLLLKHYPKAAKKPNHYGRLPLHLALESGMTWYSGIKPLFYAAPQAIQMRDVKIHLYPFAMAAVGESSDLDTVYNLLREYPQSVQCQT